MVTVSRHDRDRKPRGAEPEESRLPLQGPTASRPHDFTKDWYFLNCYFEENAGESFTISRPGIEPVIENNGLGRGLYVFQDALFWVVGDTIYNDTEEDEERPDRPIPEFTLNTSEGHVYFTSWHSDKLLVFDRDYLYEIKFDEDNEEWEKREFPSDTSADMDSLPPNLAEGLVMLAGHAYVMDRNGFIYNSYYDEFDKWDDLDFIAADNVTDRGIRLARFKQYVIAFCTSSMQVFAHAGLEPPGSPMQEIEQGFNRIGTFSPYSVVELTDTLIFVGVEHNGNYGVYLLDGFTPQKISNATIERMLEQEAEDGFIATLEAYPVTVEGHKFYCLNLYGRETTLVFDVRNQAWAEWKTNEKEFPIKHAVFYNGETRGMDWDPDSGSIHRINPKNKKDYWFNDTEYPIKMQIQTDFFDGSVIREKFLTRLEIFADIHGDVESAPGTVEWSDDDYQTWKSRDVNLAGRPVIYRLGRFKKRAFRFTSEAPVKHRWRTLDLRYYEGGYSGGST